MAIRFDVENPMVVDSLWRKRSTVYTETELIEEKLICDVCNVRLEKDKAIASEIWEDTYVCENKACLDKHYSGWSELLKIQT